MRAFATSIAVLALLLCSSCGIVPRTQADNEAELEKVKGPDTGTMAATLRDQAQQAESTGNYKGAAELYKQLYDQSPDNKDYAISLSTDLRRAGDPSSAMMVAERVLKKDPSNPAALEAKGLCLMEKGEFADAGRVFGEVMKVDAKRWRTLNAIGILFAMKNRDDDALAYYQSALNQSPDNPSVLNNVALTLAMSRQYDKAFEAFDHARKHLENDSPEIRHIDLNRALVYAIAGRLDEAEQAASPYLSKAALYNNMGFYAYLAKNSELAKSYLNMALTQDPVYYERAWKNLNAIDGDTVSDTGGAATSNVLPSSSVPQQDSAPAKKTPHAVGIPLDEIPASGDKE